jgi:hypothetical protein
MEAKQVGIGAVGILAVVGVLFFAFFGIKGCASQSGTVSRWLGTKVELPVPDDCVQVINLTKTGNTKILSYLNDKGEILMIEYSDYGYLEAKYILENAHFDENLNRKK